MSSGVDLSQFYETFFDEADELLADMERLLLELDLDEPDRDQLNAIFRAAHSIKGVPARLVASVSWLKPPTYSKICSIWSVMAKCNCART